MKVNDIGCLPPCKPLITTSEARTDKCHNNGRCRTLHSIPLDVLKAQKVCAYTISKVQKLDLKAGACKAVAHYHTTMRPEAGLTNAHVLRNDSWTTGLRETGVYHDTRVYTTRVYHRSHDGYAVLAIVLNSRLTADWLCQPVDKSQNI
jgi:hypothetical protein